MSANSTLQKRPSDKKLFLIAAIAFPLLVLIGYFKSYYFSALFDVKPVANALVHAHGIVMTAWVAYFSAQIALIRSKNVKLHKTLGLAGIALAALVVAVGTAAAVDAHLVRRNTVAGIDPHAVFLIAVFDMLLFVVFFAGAIYYRRRPAEHKTLMLMTAINFLPPAISRIPLVPEHFTVLWALGVPDLIAISCLVWHTRRHRRLNKVFLAAVLFLIGSQFLRFALANTETWLGFVGRLVS